MRVLIVDCYAVARAAQYVKSSMHMRYIDQPTNVIYGFIIKIISIAEIAQPDVIAFAWDSKHGIDGRLKAFPDYKKERIKKKKTKTPEEIESDNFANQQIDLLRDEILRSLGFSNVYFKDGFEGDDIVASLVYSNPGNKFIILSSDNDFYQLLGDDTHMILPGQVVFTEKSLMKKWGVTPDEWAIVKCIAGCKGDEVPGVERVKEKTAIKFLHGKLKETTKAYQKIMESEELIKRNFDLVVLPLDGTPEIIVKKDKTFKAKNYMDVMKRFGFMSLMTDERLKRWLRVMNG